MEAITWAFFSSSPLRYRSRSSRVLNTSSFKEPVASFRYLAMNGMRIFRESYLLYGMYPPKPLYFIQNYVNNHFTKLDYGLLSAWSSLFALVMTGLFLCIWLFLQRKEDA